MSQRIPNSHERIFYEKSATEGGPYWIIEVSSVSADGEIHGIFKGKRDKRTDLYNKTFERHIKNIKSGTGVLYIDKECTIEAYPIFEKMMKGAE